MSAILNIDTFKSIELYYCMCQLKYHYIVSSNMIKKSEWTQNILN